jgi:hypothetical protein
MVAGEFQQISIWCWDKKSTRVPRGMRKRIIDPGHVALQFGDFVYALFPREARALCLHSVSEEERRIREVSEGLVRRETEPQVARHYIDMFVHDGQNERLSLLALLGEVRLVGDVLESSSIVLPEAFVATISDPPGDCRGLAERLLGLSRLSERELHGDSVPQYDLRNFNCVTFANTLLFEHGVLDALVPLRMQLPHIFRHGLAKSLRESAVEHSWSSRRIGVGESGYTWKVTEPPCSGAV